MREGISIGILEKTDLTKCWGQMLATAVPWVESKPSTLLKLDQMEDCFTVLTVALQWTSGLKSWLPKWCNACPKKEGLPQIKRRALNHHLNTEKKKFTGKGAKPFILDPVPHRVENIYFEIPYTGQCTTEAKSGF